MDVGAKQQVLKVGGILLIVAGLVTLGWSQFAQSYVANCDMASSGPCYTGTLFAYLFGILMLVVGGLAEVISRQLPKLENDWSMPKELRMTLRRMPRDQWWAYWNTDDEETRRKIIDAELERKRKYEEEYGWPKQEPKPSDEK